MQRSSRAQDDAETGAPRAATDSSSHDVPPHTDPGAPELGWIEDGQAALEGLELLLRTTIRQHPIASLLGAAALGFACARLLRRE